MNDRPYTQWTNGLLFPVIGMAWGIASLMSGEIIIPIRRLKSLPIYEHIPLHGWSAICIASAMISISLCLHFSYFWERFPKFKRIASIGTAWIAGILFAMGIVVFFIDQFMELALG